MARSNADVKVLNEMAREMRRQRGELGDKEYLCDTSLGKVYVSQGDLIEFRANDDKLDIINGTIGTLTTLSDTRFTVSIEDAKGKQRTVTFNPETFSSYQLAYASTVFRSQGETVNRAYVAYSPGFTQKELYVAMTRHAKDVKLFVDTERTSSLSRMKHNLSRQQKEYTTQDKLQEQAQQEEKNKKITELSTSDQFTDRMKGRGLSLLGNIKDGFGNVFERFSDTRPNKQFFNPEFPEPKKGSATEVSRENAASPQEITHLSYLDIPTLSSELPTPSGENNNLVEPRFYKNHSSTGTKVLQEPSSSQKPETSLFTQYQDACNHVLNLKLIAEAESERQGKPLEQLTQFKEWQKACGERNAKAYDYLSANSHDSLIEHLGEKRTKILKDQVEKHLVYLEKSQNPPITKQEIQDKLFDNIDALLYRLYPEGPSQKKGSSLRFGAKGSLCVTLSGSKQGTWFNFEESKGGGLVELIAERNNLNNKDAHEWAKDFLKISHEIQFPKTYQNKKYTQSKETNWVPIKPPNGISEDGNTVLPKFIKDYEETARYAYRDKNGDLLFYTLRLSDKNDPTSKAVLPLSYGHWKGNSEKWAFKQYSATNRPLYNLHQLYQNPIKEVLIVEGEKAADAAKEHFPDHICITWFGGCGAVSKTDWSPLAGREVLIWPDNDKAGFKAADAITSELRKQGVKKLQVVQQQQLESFPEKWDLADALPKDVTKQKIKDISLMSKSKAIDPRRVLVEIMAPNSDDLLEQAKANQVLWRVYERMEGELLAKHKGRENLVQLDILSESARVFKAKGALQERISQELGIKGQLADNICEQSLLKSAETGTSVSKHFLEKVRDTIRESKWISSLEKDLEKLGYDQKTRDLAVSKSLTHAIENPKVSEKEIKDHAIAFASSQKENCNLQKEIQKQLSRSKDKLQSLNFNL